MEIALAWLFFAILTGVLASRFGRNGFGWFLLAVLISPLFAALLVICLPSKAPPPAVRIIGAQTIAAEPGSASDGTKSKKCPDCAELVHADAKICRFCRHDFSA